MVPLEPLDAIFARAHVIDAALSQRSRASRDQTIARLAPVLAAARAFPEGFWHPDDIESALEVMGERLVELCVAPNSCGLQGAMSAACLMDVPAPRAQHRARRRLTVSTRPTCACPGRAFPG